jgi:hypothetical protein
MKPTVYCIIAGFGINLFCKFGINLYLCITLSISSARYFNLMFSVKLRLLRLDQSILCSWLLLMEEPLGAQ